MHIDKKWFENNVLHRQIKLDEYSAIDCFEVLIFKTGETIIEQGQAAGGLYILRTGMINIMTQSDDEWIRLARDHEGALFAKHCLLDETKKSNVKIVANDHCVVYKLSHDAFTELMHIQHNLAYSILFCMLSYQEEMIHRKNIQLAPIILELTRKANKLPFVVKLIPGLFILAYSSAFFFNLFTKN
ncbi:MAG: cyclic nucleotide-binding domain-containing protein [Mariprofundaceae bacterium]